MRAPKPSEVQAFLIDRYGEALRLRGIDPQSIGRTFDLHQEGIIDSLGIMELLSSLETKYGREIDFENISAEELTMIVPLSEYVSRELTKE